MNNPATRTSRIYFLAPVGIAAALVAVALALLLRPAAAAPGDTVADRVFGQAGSFTSNAGNLGGVSANSLLNPAAGVALDAAGNLYVADFSNNRVLEYDTPLTTDTVADRVFGQGGSFTSNTCNLGGSVPAACAAPMRLRWTPPATST